jgi:hypothetical protein
LHLSVAPTPVRDGRQQRMHFSVQYCPNLASIAIGFPYVGVGNDSMERDGMRSMQAAMDVW